MSDEPTTYKQYVDSVTGELVSPEYAKANPATTYRRTVTVQRREVDLPDVVLDDAPIEEADG